MDIHHRLLAWKAFWFGPEKATEGHAPAPPFLTELHRETDCGVTGQELNESRERILSRLMAWRIEQCRRELREPLPRASTVIRFPGSYPRKVNGT